MIKNLTKPMVMKWLWTFTADDDIVGLADGGSSCPINNCLTAMFPEGQWHTGFWSASDRAHKEKVKI